MLIHVCSVTNSSQIAAELTVPDVSKSRAKRNTVKDNLLARSVNAHARKYTDAQRL